MSKRLRLSVARAVVALIGLITYAASENGTATASTSGTAGSTGTGDNKNPTDQDKIVSRFLAGSRPSRGSSSAPGTLPSRGASRATGTSAPGTLPRGGCAVKRLPPAPGMPHARSKDAAGLTSVRAEPLSTQPLAFMEQT